MQPNKQRKLNLKLGFTLVELLVTIVIFVIVTGVVLINKNQFDSVILLKNFAYDVALSIKQAQTYGVNVREGVSGAFGNAYGVYFNLNNPDGSGRINFILFNDIEGDIEGSLPDGKYNGDLISCPTSNVECIQRYTMRRGMFIKEICAGTELDCEDTNELSVLFRRPSLEAEIYSFKETPPIRKSYAKITLSSADGESTSDIVITEVGQIYILKN
jgi:prepilin-type N-terminal cleavage/methylation domain-containing protein